MLTPAPALYARSRPSVLSTFPAADFDPKVCDQVSRALESNRVVHFPRSPIPLPDPAALQHLREVVAPHLTSMVSFYPRGRRLTGLKASRAMRTHTAQILREHLEAVTAFLQRTQPRLCEGWTVAMSGFRPLQAQLSPAGHEGVHVDAGLYGATNGDRLLRVFVNLHPHEDQIWASQGTLQDVLDHHGIPSRLLDRTGRLQVRIDRRPHDRALSLLVRALARVHPRARQMDSSPYDRAMRQLNHYMKDSELFKADMRDYEEMRFGPGSVWMAFTDGVSHASVSAPCTLVSTFIIKRRALRLAHFAPYNLLAAHS